MLVSNQHLYQSPTMEDYGHCKLLLLRLRVPSWFFCSPGLKSCSHGLLGIEPTTLGLCSQSGAYDLSAMAIFNSSKERAFMSDSKLLNQMLFLLLSRDGPWPNLSILLTRSKKEADPSLTQVLFDPTRWGFLIRREKI